MAFNKNLAPGIGAAGANCKNIADPVARKKCEDAAKKKPGDTSVDFDPSGLAGWAVKKAMENR